MTKASNQTKRAIALHRSVARICGRLADEGGDGTQYDRYCQNLLSAIGQLTGALGPERGEAFWAHLMADAKLNPSLDENGEIAKVQPSVDTRGILLGLLNSEYTMLTRKPDESVFDKL